MTTPTEPATDDPSVVGLKTRFVTLTADEYNARSKRCWACEKPLPEGDPQEHLCHGCGEFFCGRSDCPASEHEMDVPMGRHDADDHMGDGDDEDED